MLPDRHTLPILGAVIVCTVPHFFNIAPWVIAACLILWIYTAAAIRYGRNLPKKSTRIILTIFLSFFAMTSHEGFTIEAFVALLALMISLKLLENSQVRDRMITIILCYFLIVGSLFFDDSIIATTYMLFTVLCTTAVMIHINQPQHGLFNPLRLSATLMIQALPIMLVMFLLFPRIQGGLWGRAPDHIAATGFSEEIAFGTVSSLVKSHEVAFRVKFDDDPPPREQLYWRGIVLWEFDGTTWRRGKKRQGIPYPVQNTQEISYTLTLEPHHKHWLFTLDLPISVSSRSTWLLNDRSCYRLKPVSQRIAYEGKSFIESGKSRQLTFPEDALQLPGHGNPRARRLAESWSKQTDTPDEIVQKALTYFQEKPFTYTLNPGISTVTTQKDGTGSKNIVDRFLFDSRKGFCEHYACSFAFLMRAAGVPARIIGGYQGGSLNQYGGYLVVRQSDAHAWCEVWLPEKGWIRIDPTAAVAPERIQTDTANVLPPGELVYSWSSLRNGPFGKWFQTVEGAWDLVNSRWNRWVMGYSVDDQVDFLSRLGVQLDKAKGLAKRLGAFLLIVLPLLFLIGFLLSRKKAESTDRVANCWMEFCRKLEGIGLARTPGQGPMDYMHSILTHRPDLRVSVQEITTLYISLRYGGNSAQKETEHLATMIKRFKPLKETTSRFPHTTL